MKPLLERIGNGERLVADGAMGTMLFREGIEPGSSLEAVLLDRPDVVERISASFVRAGADMVQTDTFGASPLNLERHSLRDKTEEINRTAVRVARRAAAGGAYVSLSCGPSGRLLKPFGDTDPEEIRAGFLEQIAAAAAEGIDLVCVETMTDLDEALLAVGAAKEAAPGVPVAATMTFDPTPNGFFTIMGVDIKRAAAGLEGAGADLIGSNCGNGLENMIRIARGFRKRTALPLLIRSNAGLPEEKDGEIVYPESPRFFAEKGAALLEAGVSVVGGCCGTTPEHVAALRAAVDCFGNS